MIVSHQSEKMMCRLPVLRRRQFLLIVPNAQKCLCGRQRVILCCFYTFSLPDLISGIIVCCWHWCSWMTEINKNFKMYEFTKKYPYICHLRQYINIYISFVGWQFCRTYHLSQVKLHRLHQHHRHIQSSIFVGFLHSSSISHLPLHLHLWHFISSSCCCCCPCFFCRFWACIHEWVVDRPNNNTMLRNHLNNFKWQSVVRQAKPKEVIASPPRFVVHLCRIESST